MNQPARTSPELQQAFLTLRPDLERFIAYRVRDPHLAEDLTSEIYLKLQRAECDEGVADIRGYLFRMASNMVIDHFKVSGRRAAIIQERGDLFETTQRTPEEQCISRSDIQFIHAALSELPAKAKEVLIRSRVEELTHGEIAEKMDISKSSVEKYVIRALRHCRDRLREADTLPEQERTDPLASGRLSNGN